MHHGMLHAWAAKRVGRFRAPRLGERRCRRPTWTQYSMGAIDMAITLITDLYSTPKHKIRVERAYG